jgi:hypothetical protein
MKPELKERRRIARNSAHEGMKTFFQRNGVEFEEGKTLSFFVHRKGLLLITRQASGCSIKPHGEHAALQHA